MTKWCARCQTHTESDIDRCATCGTKRTLPVGEICSCQTRMYNSKQKRVLNIRCPVHGKKRHLQSVPGAK